MRKVLLLSAFIVGLLPVSLGHAGSFFVTEGTWQTSPFGRDVSFDFGGPGIDAAGRGSAVQIPDRGTRFGLGTSIPLFNGLFTEFGNLTVNGADYSLNSVVGNAALHLNLTGGPLQLPSSLAPSINLQSAVALNGTMFLVQEGGSLEQHAVFGAGIANASFLQFDGGYRFDQLQVTFGFPSVPEPGAFLLLGSGLVGLGCWRRMKRIHIKD